jgi:hypothetical protein
MALGDYILCCECECKLIYDGDRDKREWWHDRWGKEPQIKCPDCETPQRTWVGLTDKEVEDFVSALWPVGAGAGELLRAIEAKLKEKNT